MIHDGMNLQKGAMGRDEVIGWLRNDDFGGRRSQSKTYHDYHGCPLRARRGNRD